MSEARRWKRKLRPLAEKPTYRCNNCGVSTDNDDSLEWSRGRACPYCGDGVIQEDSDA